MPRLVVASLADAGDGRGELPLVLEPDDSEPGGQQTHYMINTHTYSDRVDIQETNNLSTRNDYKKTCTSHTIQSFQL